MNSTQQLLFFLTTFPEHFSSIVPGTPADIEAPIYNKKQKDLPKIKYNQKTYHEL